MKAARRARVPRASREGGTAEGWSTHVAAKTVWRTHLEKRKNWLQLEDGKEKTPQKLEMLFIHLVFKVSHYFFTAKFKNLTDHNPLIIFNVLFKIYNTYD